MKINKILLLAFILSLKSVFAQQPTNLNLKDALDLVVNKSTEAILTNTKVQTKDIEQQISKNAQYPDMKLSGQYLRLTNANSNLKLNSNNSNGGGTAPKINELMLGQASFSLPLFAGFKIKNSILVSENLYQAEVANAAHSKEEIALRVVEYYASLYKAQKSVGLIKENLKSANQRVLDFTNLEKNGIIARNDLLKAQLQQSKVQLSLDEATKNVAVLNYNLVAMLKLPENFVIGIDEHQFDTDQPPVALKSNDDYLHLRTDLEALRFIKKANEAGIKIAKSNYFPSLALTGGYLALSLENVVTVTNAVNFGVGFSYNLSSLFKNQKEVKLAKNKALETQKAQEILTENIKMKVHETTENFSLAQKQNAVYQEAITQSTENYRIVKDKYDNGLSTTNDLLEADVEQLNAKINYAYSRANIMLKYYEMLAASGKLLNSFNLTK